MTTVPAAITDPVSGTFITTAGFGIPVADAINFMSNATNVRPYCHAYNSGGQTLTAGAQTAITLDAEVSDNDGMHSGSDAFLTVNTAGLYLVVAQINFPSTASGQDHTVIFQNSTVMAGDDRNFVGTSHRIPVMCLMQCAATDTISVKGQSTSGGALTTGSGATFLQAVWIME